MRQPRRNGLAGRDTADSGRAEAVSSLSSPRSPDRSPESIAGAWVPATAVPAVQRATSPKQFPCVPPRDTVAEPRPTLDHRLRPAFWHPGSTHDPTPEQVPNPREGIRGSHRTTCTEHSSSVLAMNLLGGWSRRGGHGRRCAVGSAAAMRMGPWLRGSVAAKAGRGEGRDQWPVMACEVIAPGLGFRGEKSPLGGPVLTRF